MWPERGLKLRLLAAPPEAQGFIPSTHTAAHNCNSRPRASGTLFSLLWVLYCTWGTCICWSETPVYTKIKKNSPWHRVFLEWWQCAQYLTQMMTTASRKQANNRKLSLVSGVRVQTEELLPLRLCSKYLSRSPFIYNIFFFNDGTEYVLYLAK